MYSYVLSCLLSTLKFKWFAYMSKICFLVLIKLIFKFVTTYFQSIYAIFCMYIVLCSLWNSLVSSTIILKIKLQWGLVMLVFTLTLLFFLVRGARPGKNVQLTENEIRGLCLKSREIFLSQPILLELEAPLKICGK